MSISRTLLLLLLSLFASVAEAAAQRTFVETSGNDANACTLTSPCRSFTRALTQTNSGGEIIVLDSGGYGPVTIAKSVSIIAPAGVYSGISVGSASGIVVNGAGITVELRGLTITGLGGATGINLQNAAKVVIADCRVSGMTGSGLSNSGAANVHVQDSTFRDNGGAGVSVASGSTTLAQVVSRNNGGAGVAASPGAVSVINSQIEHNGGAGIAIASYAYASIVNTTIQSNTGSGLDVLSGASARIERATILVNGQYGVNAASGNEVWISHSMIMNNAQLNSSATEVCGCAAFSTVQLIENTIATGGTHPYALAAANLDAQINLFSSNAILGADIGPGEIMTFPLR